MKENSCKNILVIDDDPAICQSMKDVLEINGYDVTVAKDGLDGIKALSAMKIRPCLILLDLMMPGMNGWGFLDFQRNDDRFSTVPVIVCSAYENSARSISKNPILTKPVKLSSLLGAVQAFCA
jgi:CheY-like chemotaxis protein